jgi:hypothetical protein
MAQYAHHPQHYLSTQPSHRLLAYKPPPPQPPQSQSFIPTTSATNVATKRSRSPSSSHIYSSPSGKSSRSSHVSQMHQSNHFFLYKYRLYYYYFQDHLVQDQHIHHLHHKSLVMELQVQLLAILHPKLNQHFLLILII